MICMLLQNSEKENDMCFMYSLYGKHVMLSSKEVMLLLCFIDIGYIYVPYLPI